MTVSTKKKLPGASLLYAATIVAFVFVNCGFATTYIKANNQTNLNTSGSWTIAGYPGSGDIGKWDNTVTATYGTISLGGDMTWAGLVIANPGGWITFNAGNTLTLGASGIDMSASTQSATISCNVALNADQTWTIAPTPALYLNGIISGAHSLTKSGAGTLFLLNVANTYSGGTTVNTGTLQVGNGGGAPGEENAAALGTGTVTVNNGTTLWFKPAGNSNVYNFANSFVLNGGTIIGEDGIQHLATGGATLGIGSGGTVEATWWGKDVYIDGLVSGSTNLAIAHGPTASNSSAIVHITNPANTFSGTVTVTPQASGVDMYLDLDNITALQSATVNLAAGTGGTSYLQLGTTNATTIIAGLTGAATVCKVQPFTSAGTYTLNVNNAVSDSFAGILQNNTTGILALTKTGAGTLTLSGNDTNSGLITVNAGKLRLTGTQRSNAVKYVINSGGIISVPDRLNLSPIPAGYTADWVTINGGTFSTGGNGYSANRGFTLGASGGTIEIPNIDNSNVVQISSVIAGTGALTKTGVGTLNLNGVNTYSGNTTISAGTLQLGAANVIPNGANKGDVSVAGTLDLNTFSDTVNGLSGAGIVTSGAAGTPTLTVGNNNVTSTFSGVIQNGSGTLAVTKIGSGTLTLSGANTYTGVTTISAGTIQIGNGGTTGAIVSNVTDNGALIFNLTNAYAYSGVISGSGTVTNAAAGTTTLTGNNTYTGVTTISAGTLQIGNGGTTGAISNSSSVTNNTTLIFNRSNAYVYSGGISGSGAVIQAGAGATTLSGNNTYSGGTNLNAGTLNINSTTALGATASRLTIAGGTTINNSSAGSINLANNNPQTWNGDFIFTGTQALSMGAGAITLGAAPQITVSASTLTEGGAISGSYGLTKAGGGTLNLQGANTYSGNTTISAGMLQLGAANVIPNGAGKGDVTVTGTLDLNAFSDTVNGLNGAGTVDNSAAGTPTLTIGNNNVASTFSGVIKNTAGSLGITKIGTGTLTLSGANTYSGPTTLSAGTLLITNTCYGKGTITCNSGTLGGTGTVAGAIKVNSGATISPGVGGIATFTTDSNLTLSSGSIYSVDIGDSTCDKINVFGVDTLNNATLKLNLTKAPLAGRTFDILDQSGSAAITGTFNGIPEGDTITGIYNTTPYIFVVSYRGGTNNNDVVLTLASSPSITTQPTPTSQAVYANSTAIFSLVAAGTGPLTYAWTQNGTTTVGSNSPACTLTQVPATYDLSTYQCKVTNVIGYVSSSLCTLHVITSIGNFSYSRSYLSGLINASFVPDTPKITGYVTKYSISPPLPAGLKIDSTKGIISGTPTVQFDSAGFIVSASNGSGGNSTAPCTIRVFAPVKVISSPVSQTAAVNGTAKFVVVASGSKPYTYTWMSQTNPPVAIGVNSDTLTLPNIDTTFNNTRYKCTVQNTFQSSYFDTSKACTLHVILPPKITQQPASQIVEKGTQVVFSVKAGGGTRPFTYAWTRNGTDSAGADSSLTLASVAAGIDKSVYRCIVRNPSGADTSALCTLRVVRAAFSGSPQTGIDSLTVSFIDSSTGGVSKWKWDFGDNTKDSVQNPTHKYTTPGAYSVKLNAFAGTVMDSMVQPNFISISYSKPKPAFSGTPLTARDSITVNFTDLSTGAVTGWQWTYGDSTPPDTTKNPSHTYKQPGSYSVKLKITGPGGVDSTIKPAYVYVYSKLDNPTRLSGRRLSTTKVELTLSNYDSIPTSKTTTVAPWSDSLGLYFRKDSLPSSPSTSALLQTINITTLQGAAKPFKDTVTVPLSAPSDSVLYGFGTALNWNDGTKSVMQGGNGTLVLMKDTVPPVNNLVISGKYLGVDTAAVYLDNISLIDTGKVDSVAVWYGLRDSVNFSDSYTKWFPVSALISGAIANRFTYKIRDPRFNTDTTHAYVAVEEMGKNLMTSAERDTSFLVGRIRPTNPIKLKAKAISSSAIQLTWNKISGYDRIRIWKGLKAVPPSPDSIPAAQYDTLIPAVTDTAILATGLLEKHWYYFGAQVLQNALWSKVTDSASAKDSTPASLDTATLANTVKILKCTFDTTRNAPFVVWHVDMLDTNIKVGIEYSLNNYPQNPATLPTQIITVKSKTDSAAVKLNGPLALNATYYVSMWMYRNGKWALPTDSSEAKATTPSYVSWQTVTYFNAPHDTVLAFGGRVRLINENILDTVPIPKPDTLRIYKAPAAALNGFVPVSIGFTFTEDLASYPMHVGLKVDSSLVPKGYTLQNVRMYRQDSTGAFSVMYNTDIDTADWIVSVLTKDLDDPFIAMVDTMAPTVRVLSSTKNPETAGSVVYDTLEITDNIVNDSWVYRFAKGGNAYLPGDTLSGTTRKAKDTVYVKIPALDVTNSAGVRAIFVANDAVHFVTRDLSRQVIRDSAANTISTAARKWTPLWVTTTLDTSPANIVLEDLGTKSGWTYDIMKFRLFRWLSYDGNANNPDNKWVEYADSISWMFNFVPGDLFWIKTKTPTVLHLGSGVTTPLTQPSKLVLAPGALSDVALPFDFSIRVGDIIDSTNSDSEKARGKGDSLQYNIFVQDTTGRWRLEPLYYSDWGATAPEHMNKADSITGGFCVYNPFSVPVTLNIPAIPTSLSNQIPGSAKRKAQTVEGWSVRIKGRTAEGSLLSTVYCGQSEGKITQKKFYPAMPLIEGAGIRVCDDKLHQWGHEMAQGLCAKDGGVTYLLAFNAQSGTTGEITYHVENIEALPKGLKAVIMVPGSELLADPSAQQSVSVSAGSGSSFRKLVIGNASYIAKAQKANAFFRLALLGVSPNPFGRMLRIRYSLPYDGIGRVEFSMIDLRGRQLWSSQGAIGPGQQEFLWNGASAGNRPVSSGMYLLRMKALDTKGKTSGVFTARITYLP